MSKQGKNKSPVRAYDKDIFPALLEEVQEWRANTTFFTKFKDMEKCGIEAVKNTFDKAFSKWKNNPKYIGELKIVTQALCYLADGSANSQLEDLYSEYHYKCVDWAASDEAGFSAEDRNNIDWLFI